MLKRVIFTGLMLLTAPVYAQQAAPLTVDSTVQQLLDNPKTLAVLKADIPTVIANPQFQMAGQLPLRAIAQFEPQALSDANMKKLSADLASAQAK